MAKYDFVKNRQHVWGFLKTNFALKPIVSLGRVSCHVDRGLMEVFLNFRTAAADSYKIDL